MESFRTYVISNHEEDLIKILESSDVFNSYSINIDFLKLFESDPILGDGILCNPKNILPKCDSTLFNTQKQLLEERTPSFKRRSSLKQYVYARFFGLPVCPELHRITIPKNKDVGCFLKLTGTAIRITQAKMLEYRKNYKCLKCNHIQQVEGKYEHRYVIKAPIKCKNPEQNCRSTTLSPVHDVSKENCKDYQEMKIQEQVNKLAVGGIPGSLWVTLEDDLVDCCKPGDDVSICGIVMRRWHPIAVNKKSEVELVFKANHIEVCNAQKSIAVSLAPDVKTDFGEFWSNYEKCPMKGRDVILASVCPKVYGLYMVKLALTLTVITGCSHNLELDHNVSSNNISPTNNKSDRTVRGQCHLLLVGDPGTGKSQLLKAGAMLTSRSVLTSGSGSTKAGLTCTALREDGEWQLEAGALVLADGGACCIDELAQMREHDRSSIHEAMEQQTISVAKAGIICKLNTRCAVIAACNPKGSYDTEQPLSINVSLGTPLLSRFDLIFILLDTQTQSWDKLVADYILFGDIVDTVNIKSWPLERLQLYLSLIGPYDVTMTQSATEILQAYYVRQRKAENRDPSRTTVRMLDSLVRLSQAHARLMNRHIVKTMDAITAVTLMDLSMQDCTLTGSSDALQTTFSKHPDFVYLKTAKQLLTSLNLYEIWHNELLFYSPLLNIDTQQLSSDIDSNNPSSFEQFAHIGLSESILNVEEVVESSYFANKTESFEKVHNEHKDDTKTVSLNGSGYESENDDLDTLFDVKSSSPKNKQVQFCIRSDNLSETSQSRDNVLKESATKQNNPSENIVTADLLAKSIKKHSLLNKNVKSHHIGIITGKKKGNRKRKIEKKIQKKKSDLKEINKSVKRKRKDNEENINKQKRAKLTNNKSNIIVSDNSSISVKSLSENSQDSTSDNELDENQMLNCLPSVNDPFHGLNINFNVSDDDYESLFENTQESSKCESYCKASSDNLPEVKIDLSKKENNTGGNIHSTCNASEENESENKIKAGETENNKKVSPVSSKTLKKLQNFSYSSKEKTHNDSNKPMEKDSVSLDIQAKSILHDTEKTNDLNRTSTDSLGNVSFQHSLSNNSQYSNSNKLILSRDISKTRLSQRSIFESDVDNYDDLDL